MLASTSARSCRPTFKVHLKAKHDELAVNLEARPHSKTSHRAGHRNAPNGNFAVASMLSPRRRANMTVTKAEQVASAKQNGMNASGSQAPTAAASLTSPKPRPSRSLIRA